MNCGVLLRGFSFSPFPTTAKERENIDGEDKNDTNDDDDDDNNNNNNNNKLIDVAIPSDRNVVQKETEKKLKYKSLCIEIQRMLNLKCTIVPVIIGATGRVNEKLKEKFGNCARKTFDRFTTKDSYTWNITHNTESTAV